MEKLEITEFSKFYYYIFDDDYLFLGHSHASWEINIVIGGKMSVTYGGDVITLSEGDFFVGEPWGFHCNRVMGEKTEMAVLQFSCESGGNGNYYARHLTEDEFSVARLLIDEFFCGRRGVSFAREISRDEQLLFSDAKKLCEVLACRVMSESKPVPESNSPQAGLYGEAAEFMENNITCKLSVEDIAKGLHVSPAVLKSVFKKFTGGGVMSYFMQMKVRCAKKMIERGQSLSFVSDTLGFSSQCYFSTVFSKIAGETPKSYQKKYFGK